MKHSQIYCSSFSIRVSNIYYILLSQQVIFFASDPKVLNLDPSYSEKTVFTYDLPLFGEVMPDTGTFLVKTTSVELKVVKAKAGVWQAISPVASTPPGNT